MPTKKVSNNQLILTLVSGNEELHKKMDQLYQEQRNMGEDIKAILHKLSSITSPAKKELPAEAKIHLSEIVVPKPFLQSPPRKEKVEGAIEFYKEHGKFDKIVTVKRKNMLLVDGYKRYVAAEKLGLKEILVRFV